MKLDLKGRLLFLYVCFMQPYSAELFDWTLQPANPTLVRKGEDGSLTWKFTLTADEQTKSQTIYFIKWKKFNQTSSDYDLIASITFLKAFVTVTYKEPRAPHIEIVRNDQATLLINNVRTEDEGTYKIEYSIEVDGTLLADHEVNVTVLVPVEITDQVPGGGDQIVPEGGNLHMFCHATGRPTPDIFWTKVLADGSGKVSHDEPTWNFTNISISDSGTYSCVADNKVEDPKRGQEVKVIVNATVIITDTQEEYIVAVRESVTVNCEAKGNPSPSYTWTPCGQDQVCNKSTFVIPHVSKDANYTCKAANEYTSDSKRSNVFIGGTVINITLVIASESCDSGEYDRSMLFKKLSEAFDGVFAIKFGYENVKLIDVRCGSIEVDLALHFNSTTKEKDVITELRNAVKDGKFGEFNVSAIVRTRRDFGGPTTKEPTTAKGSSNSKFPRHLCKTFVSWFA